MVEITEYCKNPGEYDSLPLTTKVYYNGICDTRAKVESIAVDIKWNEMGKFVVTVPLTMIQGILTPEGLAFLAKFEGVLLGGELVMNVMLRSLAKGVGKNIMESAAKMALEEGTTRFSFAFINNAIMTKALTTAIEAGSYASYALTTLKLISTSASVVLSILNIVMIIGMIIDMIDPSGYNEMLDADNLEEFIKYFNLSFTTSFLDGFINGQDEFGNPIYGAVWPVEYYADQMLNNETTEEYDAKAFIYNIEYLAALKYNSLGQLICYGQEQKTLINNPMIEKAAKRFSLILSDNNTIVYDWIYRLWPILLVFLILIIIFLVALK